MERALTPHLASAGFSVAMLCGLATAGHAAHLGDAFWLGLAGTGAHLAWQVRRCPVVSPMTART